MALPCWLACQLTQREGGLPFAVHLRRAEDAVAHTRQVDLKTPVWTNSSGLGTATGGTLASIFLHFIRNIGFHEQHYLESLLHLAEARKRA